MNASPSASPLRIAVLAGDGIGQEVVPEGLRVLDAAARRFGIALQLDHFDFASCDYYLRHGAMLPANWKEQIGGHDAILFGAVGWPQTVPDHVSLWGSLLQFRREFDQYVNLRPAKLMPGVHAPLIKRDGSAYAPGEIDMLIVRENTGMALGLLGVIIFSLTLPFTRIVVQEIHPLLNGLGRALFAAIPAAALLLWRRERWPSWRQVRGLCLVIAGVILGFPVLSPWAMQMLALTSAASK